MSSRVWALYIDRVGTRFHVSLGARIQGGRSIQIGDRFYAGRSLWIEAVENYIEFSYRPRIEIGSNVVCSDFVHIAATTGVSIGDSVLIGSHVHITDHSHGVYVGEQQSSPDSPPSYRRLSSGNTVTIERNVWLGDGVIVLPGVTIGAGSIVGANSVVAKDIPSLVIAVGSPARPIKRFDFATSTWVRLE
jgi:lipopolysaccharide O-acetyltransferase